MKERERDREKRREAHRERHTERHRERERERESERAGETETGREEHKLSWVHTLILKIEVGVGRTIKTENEIKIQDGIWVNIEMRT